MLSHYMFGVVGSCTQLISIWFFFLMRRRPPRSTRTAHSFPTRRSSDLGRIDAIRLGLGIDLEDVGAVLFGVEAVLGDVARRSHRHVEPLAVGRRDDEIGRAHV